MRSLTLSVVAVVFATACGPKATGKDPRQRYLDAVQAKIDGDSAAYYRGLVALANDSADSRAGRRARATLTSGSDWVLYTALAGSVASMAIPRMFASEVQTLAEPPGPLPSEIEVRATLTAIAAAEQELKDHTGRYGTLPRGFADGIEAQTYFYFLAPGQPLVVPRGQVDLTADRAAKALKAMQLKPRVGSKNFLAVAVGNLDSDPDLDVWTIDEAGNIQHVRDDGP